MVDTTTTTAQPLQPVPAGPVAAGITKREDFAGQSIEVAGETAMAVMAAHAKALVEARFIMAMKRPRDLDDVRVKIMREVERPGFAEIAWYRKPVGNGVEGLSVRFFEAAARCMGNVSIDPITVYEDAQKRMVRVEVMDLETNFTPALTITIEKTVERTSLNDGRVALSVRKNSQGKLTYLVQATEDEMLAKTNALVSKARRNLLQQVVPGDITDQAKARILAIRRGDAAKDPDAARRKIVDSFDSLNVKPSDLKRWLGHDVATASPAELTDLRDLYSTIQSGETSWAEALAEKVGDGGAGPDGAAAPPKPGLDGAADRLQAQAKGSCEHPEDKNVGPDAAGNTACGVCGEIVAMGPAPKPAPGQAGLEPAAAGQDPNLLRGEAPRTNRRPVKD